MFLEFSVYVFAIMYVFFPFFFSFLGSQHKDGLWTLLAASHVVSGK